MAAARRVRYSRRVNLLEPPRSAERRLLPPVPTKKSVATSVRPLNHILVADDDDAMRKIITLGLGQAGHRVSTVCDGEAAWDALCTRPYDLVITDHDMPRMKGLDLVRRLRFISSQVPVILMSGFMPWHEGDLQGLLRPGITLDKPFSLTALMSHVHNLLTLSALRAMELSPIPVRTSLE